MPLSADTRHLLIVYDSFTDFAGGPDLPWVVEVYEAIDDDTVRRMVWALCYAWAVGQRAAGCYTDTIESMAQLLFLKLPTWEDRASQEAKADWLNQLGIQMVLPEPGSRPPDGPPSEGYPERWSELNIADRHAVEHMAAYLNLGLSETILLFHLSRVLQQQVPVATPPWLLGMPQPRPKLTNGR
jgi:hypothetical protein